MNTQAPLDPDSVAAIIAQTLHRMTLDDPKPLETLGEFAVPVTETLIKVLIERPAIAFGASPTTVRTMTDGRTALAAYVGFDFAMRCVASVLLNPLGDHRAEFEEAARLSAVALHGDPEIEIHYADAGIDERFSLRRSFAPSEHDRRDVAAD